ncbi:MAG: SH3 domain-containing protein [Clostridia bacterium]|nr:SH3 domain-containing protein [Clostridia bacterium]
MALEKAVEALDGVGCSGDSCPINVTIVGGNCYIRTAPNTDGKIVGVAHKGDKLPYGGTVSDSGWPMVEHNGQNAWVSGKYAKLTD